MTRFFPPARKIAVRFSRRPLESCASRSRSARQSGNLRAPKPTYCVWPIFYARYAGRWAPCNDRLARLGGIGKFSTNSKRWISRFLPGSGTGCCSGSTSFPICRPKRRPTSKERTRPRSPAKRPSVVSETSLRRRTRHGGRRKGKWCRPKRRRFAVRNAPGCRPSGPRSLEPPSSAPAGKSRWRSVRPPPRRS